MAWTDDPAPPVASGAGGWVTDPPVRLGPGGQVQPIPPQGLALDDFRYGLEKPVYNAATLLGRGLEALAPAGSGFERYAQGQLGEVAAARQRQEDLYRQAYADIGSQPPKNPSGSQLAGELVPTALASYAIPGSTAAGLIPRLLSNAAGGGLTSLLTGNPNAPPSELGWEAGKGALLGAAAVPATSAVARVISPEMSLPGSDVRKLMDIGVSPTPGQAAGGLWDKLEQATANVVPLVGDMIKSARRRSVVDFNTGVINDALSHIGEDVGNRTGREALTYMGDKISDAYKSAIPAAGGTLDPQFSTDLARITANTRLLPPAQRDQFDNYLQRYVSSKISPTGTMTGDGFKDAESDLGKAARDFLYNPANDTDKRNLGGALRETQTALRDWLERSNPAIAEDLRGANTAFAKMQRIDRAVARPSVDPEYFSPAQYQSAVYNEANSNAQIRRGLALSQDLADTGRKVLGQNIPNSGTPYGLAVQLGTTGLLGGAANLAGQLTPGRLAAYGLLGGGIGAGYNPYGQRALASVLASRPGFAPALAGGARALSPALATALGEDRDQVPPGLLDRYR